MRETLLGIVWAWIVALIIGTIYGLLALAAHYAGFLGTVAMIVTLTGAIGGLIARITK